MELTILQQILVGIIQGVTEWLPISSSGFLVLIFSNFFHITDINFILQNALMLHLGTFFAALIYLRHDVTKLFVSLFSYKNSSVGTKKVLNFLIISTIVSGVLGFLILKFLIEKSSSFNLTGKIIAFVVGIFLLVTGILQIKIKKQGLKKSNKLKNSDGILLGFLQGLAIFPGLSRSGITISGLLLKKFDETTALKLSFLMSLPIVFLGNIILNANEFVFTTNAIYGLVASFVFGTLTIHGLIKFSRKINFGWFIIIFAILMLISILI